MKITIPGNELSRATKILGKCVDKRMKTYGNIEFLWQNEKLLMTGTNGQQFCRVEIPLIGGDDEEWAMDAEMLEKIADNVRYHDAEFTIDGHNCVVRGNGRVRTTVMGTSISVPPKIEGISVGFSADHFRTVYHKLENAIAAEVTNREVLTGVLFQSSGDGNLVLAAMDGFKMYRLSIKCDPCNAFTVVIPKVILDILMTTGSTEKVLLETDGRRVRLTTAGVEIVGAALSGTYPDVDKFIPQSFQTETRVDVPELVQAISGCKIISGQKSLIKLDIDMDVVTVSVNSETAEYVADVPCETIGSTLKIAFNGRFIEDLVKAVDGESTTMKFNSQTSPVIIPLEADEYTGIGLLLPVRVFG